MFSRRSGRHDRRNAHSFGSSAPVRWRRDAQAHGCVLAVARARVLVALMVIVGSHDDLTSGRHGQQAKEAKLPRSRLHDPLRSTSRGRALHYQVDHFRMRRDRFHHGDSNHSQEGQHFDCPRTSFLAASRRLLPSPELRLNHTAPLQLQHSACTPPRINYERTTCDWCKHPGKLIEEYKKKAEVVPSELDFRYRLTQAMETDAKTEGEYGPVDAHNINGLNLEHRFSYVSRMFVHQDLYHGYASIFDDFTPRQKRLLAFLLSLMTRAYLRRTRRHRALVSISMPTTD